MLKISRTLRACNRVSILGARVEQFAARKPPHLRVQIRCLSVGDVFGKIDPSKVADLPDIPLPIPPKVPISELAASGQSILEELGIFSWFTPPSYLRYALETLHLSLDVPWWLSIVIASTSLRLLTIYVPILSQRMVAIQNQHRAELKEFRDRINDAKIEGDNMQMHQILLEQHKYMASKGIKMGRQAVVMLINGGVFMTNFFAIKKLVEVSYPGLETGGTLWFKNLLEPDPYMGLPFISAATTFLVFRLGIDSGMSNEQMTPTMKVCMQWAFPAVILVSGYWFSSAICVHWVTSNTISLLFAGMFRLEPVRKLLKIPPLVKYEKTPEKNPFKQLWEDNKKKRAAPQSISALRKTDYEKFKQAGKGKPIS